MVVLSGKSRLAEEADYQQDSLVIVSEPALEDRFMVGEPGHCRRLWCCSVQVQMPRHKGRKALNVGG